MSIRSAMAAITSATTIPVAPFGVPHVVAGHNRIEPDAATLAASAHLPVDELSLARLIGSEVGGLPVQYMMAVGEVVLNEARARGATVTKLLTGGPNPGFYGEQRGRYASTARPCNKRHLEAALLVLDGAASGFVRGARKFFDGKVQDGGTQGGKPLKFDALGIVRKWYGEGFRWIGPVTDAGEVLIDPYRLMLMSKGGGVSQAEAEGAITDGRKRWAGQLPPLGTGGSPVFDGEEFPWVAVAAVALLAAFSV